MALVASAEVEVTEERGPGAMLDEVPVGSTTEPTAGVPGKVSPVVPGVAEVLLLDVEVDVLPSVPGVAVVVEVVSTVEPPPPSPPLEVSSTTTVGPASLAAGSLTAGAGSGAGVEVSASAAGALASVEGAASGPGAASADATGASLGAEASSA